MASNETKNLTGSETMTTRTKKQDSTIEPEICEYNGSTSWVVFEHGTYEHSSVLAGQSRRSCIDRFDSEANAVSAYPNANVLDHSTRVSPMFAERMSDAIPGWFDPSDAGESWGEDY